MMSDIEIFENQDDIVEFGIGDKFFRVCIGTETEEEEVPVSFNGFNDEIVYGKYEVNTTYVKIDTLEYKGELTPTKEEICRDLETILNQNKDE